MTDRRSFIARSSVALAAVVAAGLAGSGQASATGLGKPARGRLLLDPKQGRLTNCFCVADDAVFDVPGVAKVQGNFKGYMAVEVGEEVTYEGFAMVPLIIQANGHSTVGFSEDLGIISVRHDASRAAPPSFLREITPGTGFPAIQEMFVNILVEIEAMPGMVLRNRAVGTLRNDNVQSFPPSNARYRLVRPMELESTASPGQTLARLISYEALINPSM